MLKKIMSSLLAVAMIVGMSTSVFGAEPKSNTAKPTQNPNDTSTHVKPAGSKNNTGNPALKGELQFQLFDSDKKPINNAVVGISEEKYPVETLLSGATSGKCAVTDSNGLFTVNSDNLIAVGKFFADDYFKTGDHFMYVTQQKADGNYVVERLEVNLSANKTGKPKAIYTDGKCQWKLLPKAKRRLEVTVLDENGLALKDMLVTIVTTADTPQISQSRSQVNPGGMNLTDSDGKVYFPMHLSM